MTNGRILKWLPLVALLVAGAAAWGSQRTVTEQHEQRITHDEQVLSEVTKMQSRIDERTQNLAAAVKENKALILQILHEIRNGSSRQQ